MRIVRCVFWWAVLGPALLWPLRSAAAAEPTRRVRSIPIGDSRIDVTTNHYGDSTWLFCNLHDDEDTSVEAANRVLLHRAGRLVELKHTGARIVAFQLGGEEFKFDPNRIFTPNGVRKTLEDQAVWSQRAQDVVQDFGQELTRLYQLSTVDVVIALHNNTDARYSAASYLADQALAKEASAVYVKPNSDPDDFFFVTDQRLFDALRQRGWNAVLQNNAQVTDDGSLSVYCGNHGITYVNVEAEHGHLPQQVQMLEALWQVLEALDVTSRRTLP